MAITTIYGPQAWTAGTFSVATNADPPSDPNYPEFDYLERVQTRDGLGPSGERIVDTYQPNPDYSIGAVSMVDFGPETGGNWDVRGAGDGNGTFYELDVYFGSDVESDSGDYSYAFSIGSASGLNMFALRVALTEGKLYVEENGSEVEAGFGTVSADDAWHTLKVQLVPSSDDGSTNDGTIRVWMKASTSDESAYTLLFEKTTSYLYGPVTPFMADRVWLGRFGLLPTTNLRIYYGEDSSLQNVVIGRGASAEDKAKVTSDLTVLLNLDGQGRTVHEPNTLYVAGKLIVTDTVTLGSSSMGLDALSDVTLTSPASLDVLAYNGSAWVNAAPVVRYAEVAVSSAELLALRATPKTLVAAPGAGKVLEFVGAVLLLDATATAYVETADNLAIRYTNGSGTKVSEDIEATGFIDQTADTLIHVKPAASAAISKTASDNQALVLHNIGDSEYTTGTGIMRVKVAYRVWSTGW